MLQIQANAIDAEASLSIADSFVHIAFERIVADTYGATKKGTRSERRRKTNLRHSPD